MGVQTETLKSIDRLLVLTDSVVGTAVLSADHAIGATAINVVAGGAVFTVGIPFRIGDGERITRYHSISATATIITIAAPGLRRAYKSGETVQTMAADIYGPLTDGGKITISRDSTDVGAADRRIPFGLIRGYGKIEFDCTFAAANMYAIGLALGMPKAKVLGAGTSIDPFQIVQDGRDFGTQLNVVLVVEATRQDLTTVRFELYAASFDYSTVALALARGTPLQVSAKVLASGALVDTVATAFLTNAGTDYSSSYTDLLDGLTEFGYCTDATVGPLSTTTTGIVAANAKVFPLTAITNLAAGDIIKVVDPLKPSTPEYHIVDGIAALNVTTKTHSLRGFASGVTVVRQVRNALGTLDENGVKLTIGGSLAELKVGVSDMVAGYRPGDVSMAIMWALQAYNLTTFALAMGLPLPGATTYLEVLTGIGNTAIGCVYATGTTQGAKALWLLGWQNQVVVNADIALTGTGNAPAVSGTARPLSGFVLTSF